MVNHMYLTQKPWRAHDTLFWVTILSLGIASFAALVAISVLAVGLTPWEIVVVRAETPAETTSGQPVEIPLVDQLCLSDADCSAIITTCGGCDCGQPINKIYEQKYRDQVAAQCQNYVGPYCEMNCPLTVLRCINSRCTLAPGTNSDAR